MGDLVIERLNYTVRQSIPATKRSHCSGVRHWIPSSSAKSLLPLLKAVKTAAGHLSCPFPCMNAMLWTCCHTSGALSISWACPEATYLTGQTVQFIIGAVSINLIANLLHFYIGVNKNNTRSHCLLTVALVRVRKKEINLHFHTLFSSKWQRCNCTWMRRQGYSVVWCFLFKICRKVNKLCTSIRAASTRKMLLSVIIAPDIDGNRRGDGGVP